MVAGQFGQAFGVGVIESQGVGREVFRRKRNRGLERLLPRRQRLAGNVVEQVQADVVEAGAACLRDGVGDVGRRVTAAERGQLRGSEALRADGEAVDAGGTEAAEVTAVGRARDCTRA